MASGSKNVIYAALVGNTIIAITKTIASVMTGSSAMLSEGIHSFVDTGNQVLLLYGIKKSQKPASPAFPFGHGKEIYFWSFVVAVLIFALGGGISLYEGIHHLMEPEPVSDPTINYIVLAFAAIVEGAAWWFAVKEFRKSKGDRTYFRAIKEGKDPALFVIVFEDTAALIGLLVALLGVFLTHMTGNPLWDGVASVLIGVILLVTAVWLAIETKGLLIGEGADPQVCQDIREQVEAYEEVKTVIDVLTMHLSANQILLAMNVEFKGDISVGEVEQAIRSIEAKLRLTNPSLGRIFIEAQSL